MKSKTHPEFWKWFNQLPSDVQRMAREKYRLWQEYPAHPSLRFKHLRDDVWSARISRDYRALAIRDRDLIVWFWIGKHGEYDRLIK